MALTRRAFIGQAVGANIVFLGLKSLPTIQPARAEDIADEAISFRWNVPAVYFQAVKDSLVFDGTIEQDGDTKGAPLLVAVFVGVVMLPALADAVLTVRRRLVQPGIKIDARGSEIKIEVDPSLPRGMILLVDGSGAKLYEPDQLSAPADLAKAIATAVGK